MIAVSLRMNKTGKSSIVRLASYLMDHQGHNERVRSWQITNCLESVRRPGESLLESDVELAARQMLWTQQQNTRAKSDKTYHLVLSFKEEPDAHTLQKIEDEFCAALGFHENERISVLHGDTENTHLHIVVNKIHPVTHRLVSPFQDHRILAATCRRLEQEYLLQPDNHEFRKLAYSSVADRMEACSDLESLTGWIKRNLQEKLGKAENWQQFHACLSEHGLAFRLHGNGCVFSNGEISVKASSVARSFSKRALEKKFGPFRAESASMPKTSKSTYRKMPVRHPADSEALWEEYCEYRRTQDERKAAELLRLENDLRTEIHARFGTSLADIAADHFIDDRTLRRLLKKINAANRNQEIKKLRGEFMEKRRKIRREYRKLSWEKWLNGLALSGRTDALMLIRSRTAMVPRNAIGMDTAVDNSSLVKVTRKGTRIFADGMRESRGYWNSRRQLDLEDFLKGNTECPARLNGSEIFRNSIYSFFKRNRKNPTFIQPEIAKEWEQAKSPASAWKSPTLYQGR